MSLRNPCFKASTEEIHLWRSSGSSSLIKINDFLKERLPQCCPQGLPLRRGSWRGSLSKINDFLEESLPQSWFLQGMCLGADSLWKLWFPLGTLAPELLTEEVPFRRTSWRGLLIKICDFLKESLPQSHPQKTLLSGGILVEHSLLKLTIYSRNPCPRAATEESHFWRRSMGAVCLSKSMMSLRNPCPTAATDEIPLRRSSRKGFLMKSIDLLKEFLPHSHYRGDSSLRKLWGEFPWQWFP